MIPKYKIGDVCVGWVSQFEKEKGDKPFIREQIIDIKNGEYILKVLMNFDNPRDCDNNVYRINFYEETSELDHIYQKEKEFNKDLKDLINE